MCFGSFEIPELRTSATGVRTSKKLRPLAPQDELVRQKISSPDQWSSGFKHLCYLFGPSVRCQVSVYRTNGPLVLTCFFEPTASIPKVDTLPMNQRDWFIFM